MKIKKGDQVLVTSGKDRGRQGQVEKVLAGQQAVLVAGLNVAKKHIRSQSEKKPGGIIEVPQPLNLGKVVLICPKCHQPTRVGFKIEKKEKYRICKKCQEVIDK